MDPRKAGAKQQGLSLQKQGECGYYNEQQSQSSDSNNLILADLWHWLVNHWVPRSEINKKFTKFLFGLYKQKVLGQVNGCLIGIIKTQSHNLSINCQNWNSLQIRIPRMKGGWVPHEKNLGTLQKIYTVNLYPRFSKMDPWHFTKVIVHWGRWNNQTFWGLLVTEFEQTLIPKESKCHCDISVRQEAYGCHLINGFYSSGEFCSWSQNSFCNYFPSSRMENWNRNI